MAKKGVRKIGVFGIIAMLLVFGSFCNAELSGDDILKKVDGIMDSPATKIEAVMSTIGNGAEKNSQMLLYTKKNAQGENRTLIQYLYPPVDKGTKFLSLGSVDKMWMYLPKVEKLVRIAGSMVKQSMMNSSFSYEDLLDRGNLAKDYSAQVVGNSMIDDSNCYVLMLNAKKGSAHYRQIKLYVHPDYFIPVKEEFLSGNGAVTKMSYQTDIAQMGGRTIPTKITFQDLKEKDKQTTLTIKSVQFNADIPERYFTQGYLEKGQ